MRRNGEAGGIRAVASNANDKAESGVRNGVQFYIITSDYHVSLRWIIGFLFSSFPFCFFFSFPVSLVSLHFAE